MPPSWEAFLISLIAVELPKVGLSWSDRPGGGSCDSELSSGVQSMAALAIISGF